MSHDNHDKSDTTEAQMYPHDYCLDECFIEREGECGIKDRELIARVGNKLKHKSVLEQIVYWFDIDGISRACLQELARHRTARLTVKSSRYTLKELKDAYENDKCNFYDFLVDTKVPAINIANYDCLYALAEELSVRGTSNDRAKYMLPEAFKTRLQFQLDGRNLQNFLSLRTSKDALWEIQELARRIYAALPSEHQYLYEECMYNTCNSLDVSSNT